MPKSGDGETRLRTQIATAFQSKGRTQSRTRPCSCQNEWASAYFRISDVRTVRRRHTSSKWCACHPSNGLQLLPNVSSFVHCYLSFNTVCCFNGFRCRTMTASRCTDAVSLAPTCLVLINVRLLHVATRCQISYLFRIDRCTQQAPEAPAEPTGRPCRARS